MLRHSFANSNRNYAAKSIRQQSIENTRIIHKLKRILEHRRLSLQWGLGLIVSAMAALFVPTGEFMSPTYLVLIQLCLALSGVFLTFFAMRTPQAFLPLSDAQIELFGAKKLGLDVFTSNKQSEQIKQAQIGATSWASESAGISQRHILSESPSHDRIFRGTTFSGNGSSSTSVGDGINSSSSSSRAGSRHGSPQFDPINFDERASTSDFFTPTFLALPSKDRRFGMNDSKDPSHSGNMTSPLQMSRRQEMSNNAQWGRSTTSPSWSPTLQRRSYSSSPGTKADKNNLLKKNNVRARVEDAFTFLRPDNLDDDIDNIRRALGQYLQKSIVRFERSVDTIVRILEVRCGLDSSSLAQYRSLLRLDADSHTSASGYAQIGDYDGALQLLQRPDVRQHLVVDGIDHLHEYNQLSELFQVPDLATSSHDVRLEVAQRIRDLASRDSHLGRMQRNTGSISCIQDSDIVMNAFFHLCDANREACYSRDRLASKFRRNHFAKSTEEAARNCKQPNIKIKAGILLKEGNIHQYNVYCLDHGQLLELTVQDGRQNCLYAILGFALLILRQSKKYDQPIPSSLKELLCDIFGGA
jgi:hypothetical protein